MARKLLPQWRRRATSRPITLKPLMLWAELAVAAEVLTRVTVAAEVAVVMTSVTVAAEVAVVAVAGAVPHSSCRRQHQGCRSCYPRYLRNCNQHHRHHTQDQHMPQHMHQHMWCLQLL